MVKINPQQPIGCKDFIKPSNAADRLLDTTIKSKAKGDA